MFDQYMFSDVVYSYGFEISLKYVSFCLYIRTISRLIRLFFFFHFISTCLFTTSSFLFDFIYFIRNEPSICNRYTRLIILIFFVRYMTVIKVRYMKVRSIYETHMKVIKTKRSKSSLM